MFSCPVAYNVLVFKVPKYDSSCSEAAAHVSLLSARISLGYDLNDLAMSTPAGRAFYFCLTRRPANTVSFPCTLVLLFLQFLIQDFVLFAFNEITITSEVAVLHTL